MEGVARELLECGFGNFFSLRQTRAADASQGVASAINGGLGKLLYRGRNELSFLVNLAHLSRARFGITSDVVNSSVSGLYSEDCVDPTNSTGHVYKALAMLA